MRFRQDVLFSALAAFVCQGFARFRQVTHSEGEEGVDWGGVVDFFWHLGPPNVHERALAGPGKRNAGRLVNPAENTLKVGETLCYQKWSFSERYQGLTYDHFCKFMFRPLDQQSTFIFAIERNTVAPPKIILNQRIHNSEPTNQSL